MFTYYLSSLHELREKNLELSRATTQAWLEVMAHLIDGHYLIGRAVLHPAATPLESHHAGLHWEKVSTNDHQELVMKWLDEGIAKATKAQEIIFAAFTHHTAGWSELGHELVQKLQRDAGPEYADALQFIDQAMRGAAMAESAALNIARQSAKAPRTANKIPAKVPTKTVTKTVRETAVATKTSGNTRAKAAAKVGAKAGAKAADKPPVKAAAKRAVKVSKAV